LVRKGRGAAAETLSYFAQEWIEGASLRSLRGKLRGTELLRCARDLLGVVAFLHHLGLTGLDIKPQHVLRSELGWRLIDLDQAGSRTRLAPVVLQGTLPYLAPEALQGMPPAPVGDLYSVGATLYEALSGGPPALLGKTLEQVAGWLPGSPIPDLAPARDPDGEQVRALIEALLQRSPKARPQSAPEALERLGMDGEQWRQVSGLPVGAWVGSDDIMTRLENQLATLSARGGGALLVAGLTGGGQSRCLSELDWGLQGQGRATVSLSLQDSELKGGGLTSLFQRLAVLAGEFSHPPGGPGGASPSRQSSKNTGGGPGRWCGSNWRRRSKSPRWCETRRRSATRSSVWNPRKPKGRSAP